MTQPNPLAVAISVMRALVTVRAPSPSGSRHGNFFEGYEDVLSSVAKDGVASLPACTATLDRLVASSAEVAPDDLSPSGSTAFWLNLYNATALRLAASAFERGVETVWRVPEAFSRPVVTVAGERLSLDAIEHAKLRRMGDPRIHGALVCGSVSCPTLRSEPYRAAELDHQLDDQMCRFLANGGAVVDGDRVSLSRIFKWYGGDFTRPHRMPAWLPARRRKLIAALRRWHPALPEEADVEFQAYDWGLACTVG